MILKNARVICPKSNLDDILDIEIQNGIITTIAKDLPKNVEQLDCSGKVIAPAFIEMHAHLRDPGLTDKETIQTGTNAARNGGYAQVCCMANTIPVNDNQATLKHILSSDSFVKVLPICAITKGLLGKELTDIIALKELGAIAFSDDGKPIENMQLLKTAMEIAKAHDILLISHAEDSSINSTNSVSEDIAVARELELVRIIGCRYHFAHISTKRSIELIRHAKKDGVKVTCETAPHYFSLTKGDIKNANPLFKVNPPLRNDEDLKAVIDGLSDGTIDVIATDHAPHTLIGKQKSWNEAPMGMTGFETAFGVSYTYLVKSGLLNLNELLQKMTLNPSSILGLYDSATIKEGAKANLVLIDENKEWVVNSKTFKTKAKHSPFEGKTLTGKVIKTIIKGEIYDCI